MAKFGFYNAASFRIELRQLGQLRNGWPSSNLATKPNFANLANIEMAGQVRTWPPNGTSPTWPTSNIERSYIIIFELGHWIFYSKGKNKNRGTSVVKRHVPFLFSVFVKAAVPEPPSPRRRERSKPECRALPKEKESMEWRNRNPLQKVPQPWLDLTNLAVTTGYHSLS